MVTAQWAAIVPVKRLDVAKSRLRGAVAGVPHRVLVVAMARDTVAAVLDCPAVHRVLVVTDDPVAGAALAELGAEWVRGEPAGGINAALTHGAAAILPGTVDGLVALTADLPALRAVDLTTALRAVDLSTAPRAVDLSSAPRAAELTTARRAGRRTGQVRAYVPDAAGTGTSLLAAAGGAELQPRFGPDSAAAHAASGAVRLDGSWPSLRRDVDTPADLAAAARIGLGRYTSALIGTAHCRDQAAQPR